MQPAAVRLRLSVMRNRKLLISLAAALIAVGITLDACSQSPHQASGTTTEGGSAAANGAAAAPRGSATSAGAQAASAEPPTLTARDLVFTATLSIRVRDVSAATQRTEQLVSAAHGFVGNEQLQSDPARPGDDTASMTVRVPESSYDAMIASLTQLGTRVSEQQTVEDVTDQVVDTSSRLATAKVGIARVRALLDRASTLGQVIDLESELTKRESALESLEQRLAALRRQVALATIDVTFSRTATKVVAAKPHRHSGFIGGIDRGWHAFTRAGNGLLAGLGAALPFGLAVVVLAVVVVVLRRRLRSAPTVGNDLGG